MDTETLKPNGHSADVRIQLHINGQALPVAQLGPGFLILRTPCDSPPSDGEITMSIDGREDRWRVRLAEGIKAEQRKTAITRCPESNGSAVR
jgi:hypothetical protein